MATTKSARRKSSTKTTPAALPGSALWLLTETQGPRAVAASKSAKAASVAKHQTPTKPAPAAAKATRQSATTVKKKPATSRNKDDCASNAPVRKRLSTAKGNGTSLVHDAVRRAFHASVASAARSDEAPDCATECERLRQELERVMADHQRQADEIVALRALAKSLKEEVEMMQESLSAQQRDRDVRGDSAWSQSGAEMKRAAGHEFFKLDAQIDVLTEENTRLRDQLTTAQSEKHELQVVVDNEMPRFEMLSVHAQAELASTVSQLRDEQAENDRLRSEVAYYKARSRSPVRVERQQARPLDARENGEHNKENDHFESNSPAPQPNTRGQMWDSTLRESLMSSVASMSMSAASVFSSQLENDVETLKSELRRLHRSIDASVENSRRYGNSRTARHAQPVEERKTSE